jgi:hypothetical protein
MVTATTGGAGNIPVSIAEDVAATGVSILALILPIIMGILLVSFFILLAWWLAQRARRAQRTA